MRWVEMVPSWVATTSKLSLQRKAEFDWLGQDAPGNLTTAGFYRDWLFSSRLVRKWEKSFIWLNKWVPLNFLAWLTSLLTLNLHTGPDCQHHHHHHHHYYPNGCRHKSELCLKFPYIAQSYCLPKLFKWCQTINYLHMHQPNIKGNSVDEKITSNIVFL